MKLFAIVLASLALLGLSSVVPSYASCHTVVVGSSDQANHQSSLSSTTEGGANYKTVCTAD